MRPAVIETAWLPYPFTLNWQMTRPGKVRFRKGDPICMLFPVPARSVQDAQTEIRNLADDPNLASKLRVATPVDLRRTKSQARLACLLSSGSKRLRGGAMGKGDVLGAMRGRDEARLVG